MRRPNFWSRYSARRAGMRDRLSVLPSCREMHASRSRWLSPARHNEQQEKSMIGKLKTLRGAAIALAAVGMIGAAAAPALAQSAPLDLYGPKDAKAQRGGTLTFGSLVEPPGMDP